jgi:hypothetical protein
LKTIGLRFRWVIASLVMAASLAAPLKAHAANSSAPGGPFGLGIILGEPTGITGKYFMDNQYAIDCLLTSPDGFWFMATGSIT